MSTELPLRGFRLDSRELAALREQLGGGSTPGKWAVRTSSLAETYKLPDGATHYLVAALGGGDLTIQPPTLAPVPPELSDALGSSSAGEGDLLGGVTVSLLVVAQGAGDVMLDGVGMATGSATVPSGDLALFRLTGPGNSTWLGERVF